MVPSACSRTLLSSFSDEAVAQTLLKIDIWRTSGKSLHAWLCRLTGSQSAVLCDVLADHSSHRQQQTPELQQHVQRQAADIHAYQPGLCQHGWDEQHHKETARENVWGQPETNLVGSQEEAAGPVQQPEVSQEGAQALGVQRQAVRQLSCQRTGAGNQAVQSSRQQQPVALPRQQSSEMYHTHQPGGSLSSPPAQHPQHDDRGPTSAMQEHLGEDDLRLGSVQAGPRHHKFA